MKKITILTVMAMFLAITADATIWRVNNRPGINADFTTLQNAIDGASANDTIYIGGSANDYGPGIFNKKLVVLGAGYWHAENDSMQAYEETSWVKQLSFNAGSEGSVISGLYIYNGNYGQTQNWKLINISADSITIQRNFIYGYSNHSYTYWGYSIYVTGNRTGITIQQNWITNYYFDNYYTTNGVAVCIGFNGMPTNTIIRNNFIRSYLGNSYGTLTAIYLPTYYAATELTINNNVIWGNITTSQTFHINNILMSGTYTAGQGDLYSNNICSGTQFPAGNGNVQNAIMDDVFVDYDLYIDNGYYLKPTSPAKNAGFYGGDCGVFSTDYLAQPYRLSGMPAIPSVFEATFETVGASQIPVNIKARSNN